jgi:hypothetical protein
MEETRAKDRSGVSRGPAARTGVDARDQVSPWGRWRVADRSSMRRRLSGTTI